MELVGQRVKLHDLKAKSYLNDSYGVTTAWDDSKGRVSVKLDSGEVVAIKLDNLTPIPADGGSWWWPFGGGKSESALDPAAMAKMSQEELLEQVKKLRTERSEEVEMAKDA